MYKKIIYFLVVLSLIISLIPAVSFGASDKYEINTSYELENTSFKSGMYRVSSPSASGGYYIRPTYGNIASIGEIKNDDISMIYNIPKDGEYNTILRVYFSNTSAVNIYYRWDDGDWKQYKGTYTGDFKWEIIDTSYLTSGLHKLELCHREYTVCFDSIYVTDDKAYIPEEPKDVVPMEKPVSSKLNEQTKECVVSGDGAVFEVEDCTLKSGMTILGYDDASGKKAVKCTIRGTTTKPAVGAEGVIEFTFTATRKGRYNIWVRGLFETTGSRRWFTAVDNSSFSDVNYPIAEGWSWTTVGQQIPLEAGQTATLRINPVHMNWSMDQFLVTSENLYMPEGMVKEVVIPENPTLVPNTPLPPYNPKKGQHPRIHFTPDKIDDIKANIEHPENAYAKSVFEANVNKTIKLPKSHDESILEQIESKALYYALYGDEKRGREAIDLTMEVGEAWYSTVDNTGGVVDYYRYTGRQIYSASMIYDWCYPLLTEEEKNRIITTCIGWQAMSEIGWPPDKQLSMAGHGAEEQLLREMIAFAIATYDERPDIWDFVGGRFYTYYVPERLFLHQGGIRHEGTNYGIVRHKADLYSYLLITGMGAPAPYDANQLGTMAYGRQIYTRRPDGMVALSGDGYNTTPMTYALPYTYTTFMEYVMSKDPYVKDEFVRSAVSATRDGFITSFGVGVNLYLIVNDVNVERESIYNLPNSKYFGTPNGVMVARTGWDEGIYSDTAIATMHFNEYYTGAHQHFDAGNFELYYKGPLATDSGVYKLFGTEEHSIYTRQTVAHNCILVYDPDEPLRNFTVSQYVTNTGGQKNPYGSGGEFSFETMMNDPEYRRATVISQEIDPENPITPEYTYIKGNLANAYSDKVKDYNRSFMFLDLEDEKVPAALIVFDKLDVENKEFKKTWLLHGQTYPEISGNRTIWGSNEYKSPLGYEYEGKMVADALLPKKVTMDVVGGEDDGWSMVNGVKYVGLDTSATREENTYRLEVSPVDNEETTYFLNCLQVTDRGNLEYLEAKLIENDYFYGVEISDRIVMFSKSASLLKEEMTFEIIGSEKRKFTICDLEKGVWEVNVNGKSETYTVTEEGNVLAFSANGEKIIKKTDRFGNTIKYLGWHYGWDGFIDTFGRRIDFEYTGGKISAIKVDGETYVKYENISENDNVKDPDNKYVTDNIHTFKVTKGFDDIENNTVIYKGRYRHNTWDLGRDLNGKGAIPTFSGLTFNIEEITLPSGGKIKYNYEEKKYKIPKMEAISRDRIRIVSKENYQKDSTVPENVFTYGYDQTDMYNRVATTCKDGTDYEYKEIYNRRSQLIKTEETISGGRKEITYTYETTLERNELPIKVTTKIYKDGNEDNPLVSEIDYEYNSCQQPVTESDGLQTKKSSYGANGIKISEEVYQSSGKMIRTYNTLNSAQTSVIKTQIQSKGTNASTYTTEEETNYLYNEFGEVTKATKSGETEEDNRITEISYEYLPFDDSNPDKNTLIKTTTIKNVSNISENTEDVSVTEYYNYFGNVYKTVNGNGGVSTVIYDSLQRPVKNIYPDNTFETVSYNQSENDITLTDKNGTVQKIDYDSLGRESAVYIDGEIVTSLTYTPHSLPETKNVYSEGNTIKSTMKYEYYSDGQPKSEMIYEDNKLLGKSEYSYSYTEDSIVNETKLSRTASDIINIKQVSDKYGRVTSETIGDRTRYLTYDIMGNVLTDKDYKGNITTYSYDYANRPLSTKDARGNTEYISYNKFGEPVATTDKMGNTTSVSYNKLGKETEVITPENTKTLFFYDKNGNLTQQKIQNNKEGEEETYKISNTVYDSMNRPVYVIVKGETVDNITKYVYDNNGNVLKTITGLTSVSEEENSNIHQITSFTYNNLNKPVCITYPDGLSVINTYDKLGNVLTTTDKSGTVTEYSYDGLGQLLDITATDSEKEEKISYTYDLTGNMLSMTDSSGVTQYEYDNYCMPVKESKDSVLKSYSYDKNGNRTSFKLSVDGEQKISLSYGYDVLNRLTSVSGNGTNASYTYDKAGKLTKETTNGVDTLYTYDKASRITGKTNQYRSSTESFGVSYYADGNIESITENSKPTISYIYDNLGRLTKETVENESITTYSYDNFQNRIRKIKEDISGNILSETGYTYGKNNLLLNETELSGNKEIVSSYKYDKDGNTLSKTIAEFSSEYEGQNVSISEGAGNSFYYEYDPLNRLTRASHNNFDSLYTYDGNGLRQSKTVNGITTKHLYDGQNIVMDNKDVENQLYIRGLHLIARDINGSKEFYSFNIHNDTTKLVNQSGTILKDYSYDAFGNQKTENENDTNPFRYSGEYFDTESGLIYLRARYYDPTIGRFISEDPIKDGLNWYVYCSNNPVMFVDPLGLDPWELFSTKDEAAEDFGFYIGEHSIETEEEFFSFIFMKKDENGNEVYYYDEPRNDYETEEERKNGFYFKSFDVNAVAVAHTHGSYDAYTDNKKDGFSYPGNSLDKKFSDTSEADRLGVDYYVATPAGNLYRYDTNSGDYKGTLLSSDMPVDPRIQICEQMKNTLLWKLLEKKYGESRAQDFVNAKQKHPDSLLEVINEIEGNG